MVRSEEQSSEAESSISVTDSGMVMDTREEHLKKEGTDANRSNRVWDDNLSEVVKSVRHS